MKSISDIIIVGAGIIGCALADELSRYEVSVTVLEKGPDVASGATKANSGIVHAGYDAVPGTNKAKFNVAGAAAFPKLCRRLNVPYRRCGALVVGFGDADSQILRDLYCRGLENGVPGLKLLDAGETLKLEPRLNSELIGALYVPSSGIVSPYELAFALSDEAALNGVNFYFDCSVRKINKQDEFYIINTNRQDFCCRLLINCAGASSGDLHNQISDLKLKIIHRKGEYYLLDRNENSPFSHTIFQCPSAMGKGVLISPSVHGNTLIGPSAEDIADPDDTSTTQSGLSFVLNKARLSWPGLSVRDNITNFSGIRAHEAGNDFLIGKVSGCAMALEAAGIESPGLSSAPAVAEYLSAEAALMLGLQRKNQFRSLPPRLKPFSEMTDSEKEAAVSDNPKYGNIICRCETVTEAEIIEAIHRPIPAKTVDAVKRRTRAGMGRCQGGFCLPRVAEIISEETGIPLAEVTKNGGSSNLLTGLIDDIRKSGRRNTK